MRKIKDKDQITLQHKLQFLDCGDASLPANVHVP